ncbi:copper resistance CopC/CopD family protein [Paenochrobactrum pullorum]|uniref:copper resistance CopC/CopD family protein n=1 Tax=Paenochrobactrum pullorum TaxID=1324351 RepID=UPI0035BC947A
MPRISDLSRFTRLGSISLFLWLILTTLASAHASLTGTTPVDGAVTESAPKNFSLAFSEPVSPLVLKLIRPDGSAVELKEFTLHDQTLDIVAPKDLDNGTHVLTWRVVSSDGHPVGGSVVFSIGAASAAPPQLVQSTDLTISSLVWFGKLLLYITLFVGIGGAFAIHWLWPAQKPARVFIFYVLGGGLIATILSLGLQGLDALGSDLTHFFAPQVWQTGIETSYGQTVFALVGAVIIAFLSLLIKSKGLAQFFSLSAVLLGAVALALSGHASAAPPRWLTRPSVFLHALMITLWIGALIPLGLALCRNNDDLRDGLRRFSNFIPFALIILIVAGTTLTIIQVEHRAALIGTAYGKLLIAKLAVLFLLFLLAAYNRWKLTDPVMHGDVRANHKLARAIIIETLLVFVIFGIASGWRFTPPPRSIAIAEAQPAEIHIHTNKAMADVKITPGRSGPVSVSAILMDGDFAPLEAQEVTFVFSQPEAGIEPFSRKAKKAENGSWQSDDVLLPLAGKWKIRLDILINDFELARLEEDIQIRP